VIWNECEMGARASWTWTTIQLGRICPLYMKYNDATTTSRKVSISHPKSYFPGLVVEIPTALFHISASSGPPNHSIQALSLVIRGSICHTKGMPQGQECLLNTAFCELLIILEIVIWTPSVMPPYVLSPWKSIW
jgi:hypothetical protein